MAKEGSRDLSDEERVRLVLGGDEASAADLFDRHVPAMRATVHRRLPRRMRSKLGDSDVLQEAMLAAYRHLHDFEDPGEGSFRRWLFRIVERKIATAIRVHLATGKRDARREEPIPDAAHEPPEEGRATPPEVAIAEEALRALRAGMAELSPDHRAVIDLAHREGLTLAKAAERMQRSPAAVRKLYGRAVSRLAERVEGDPEEA